MFGLLIEEVRQRTIESLISTISFVARTSDSWCVNSVQRITFVIRCKSFRKTRRPSDGEIVLNLGSEVKAIAMSMGVVTC